MRDFRDAKAMAQTLRKALNAKSISISHSESLELVAKILGLRDWNVLAARIRSESKVRDTGTAAADAARPLAPIGTGLPLVPLRDLVLYPQMTVPIFVGRDKSRRAVERAVSADRRILAVAQRRVHDDNPAPEDLYRVGVTASVLHVLTLPDERLKVTVIGLQRASIVNFVETDFLTAEVSTILELRTRTPEALALSRSVVEAFQTYANVRPGSLPQALVRLPHIREAGILADTVAQFLSIGMDQRQDLLETSDVVTRLEKILELMKTDRQAA